MSNMYTRLYLNWSLSLTLVEFYSHNVFNLSAEVYSREVCLLCVNAIHVSYQAELEAEKKQKDKEKTVPHLSNLNEDPALTGKIIHFLEGKVKIGCAKGGKTPDITLVGLG